MKYLLHRIKNNWLIILTNQMEYLINLNEIKQIKFDVLNFVQIYVVSDVDKFIEFRISTENYLKLKSDISNFSN